MDVNGIYWEIHGVYWQHVESDVHQDLMADSFDHSFPNFGIAMKWVSYTMWPPPSYKMMLINPINNLVFLYVINPIELLFLPVVTIINTGISHDVTKKITINYFEILLVAI